MLAALNDAGARYLIVGGVAVVLHGRLRLTADLDLVVELEENNLSRALAALAGLGYNPRAPVPLEQFADPEIRQSWIRDKNMQVFSLWHPEHHGFEIDLFVSEPFDFEAAWKRRTVAALSRTDAPVASIADLIALKRAAGRPIDLEDVAALGEIQREGDRG